MTGNFAEIFAKFKEGHYQFVSSEALCSLDVSVWNKAVLPFRKQNTIGRLVRRNLSLSVKPKTTTTCWNTWQALRLIRVAVNEQPFFSSLRLLKKKYLEYRQQYGSGHARSAYVTTRLAYLQPKDPLQPPHRRQPVGQWVAEECSTNGIGSEKKRKSYATFLGLCNNTILHRLLIYVTPETRRKTFHFSLLASTLGTLWGSHDTSRGLYTIK